METGYFLRLYENLGTSDAVTNMYGTGTNVDQLLSGTAELTYNVPHWKLGVEYNLTSAWYGSLNHSNGKWLILILYLTTVWWQLHYSCFKRA